MLPHKSMLYQWNCIADSDVFKIVQVKYSFPTFREEAIFCSHTKYQHLFNSYFKSFVWFWEIIELVHSGIFAEIEFNKNCSGATEQDWTKNTANWSLSHNFNDIHHDKPKVSPALSAAGASDRATVIWWRLWLSVCPGPLKLTGPTLSVEITSPDKNWASSNYSQHNGE